MQSHLPNPNASQVVSPFPPPPDYARQYSGERVAMGNILAPPPVQNEFVVFGEEYKLDDDIIRPLSSQKITQLYPSNRADWKTEMKKLNKSVIAAFLDLLEIMIKCPEHPDRHEKLNDIQTIFINMHHLINEYRPLQARDTISMMQQEQVAELDEVTGKFRDFLNEAKDCLKATLDMTNVKVLPVPPMPAWLNMDSSDDEVDEEGEKMEDVQGGMRTMTVGDRAVEEVVDPLSVASTSRVTAKPDRDSLHTGLDAQLRQLERIRQKRTADAARHAPAAAPAPPVRGGRGQPGSTSGKPRATTSKSRTSPARSSPSLPVEPKLTLDGMEAAQPKQSASGKPKVTKSMTSSARSSPALALPEEPKLTLEGMDAAQPKQSASGKPRATKSSTSSARSSPSLPQEPKPTLESMDAAQRKQSARGKPRDTKSKSRTTSARSSPALPEEPKLPLEGMDATQGRQSARGKPRATKSKSSTSSARSSPSLPEEPKPTLETMDAAQRRQYFAQRQLNNENPESVSDASMEY